MTGRLSSPRFMQLQAGYQALMQLAHLQGLDPSSVCCQGVKMTVGGDKTGAHSGPLGHEPG